MNKQAVTSQGQMKVKTAKTIYQNRIEKSLLRFLKTLVPSKLPNIIFVTCPQLQHTLLVY